MDPYQATDEELMHEFQLGNSNAMATIFERHKRGAFNFALRFLNNRSDAEDAFSEAITLVCEKKNSYRASAKFVTWFYTIVRNVCISRIRKSQKLFSSWMKNDQGDLEEMQFLDTKELASETMATQELIGHVQKAIAKLPEEQKEALIFLMIKSLKF